MDDREIDRLLAEAGRPVRPSAEFEEDLLQRMEAELSAGVDPAATELAPTSETTAEVAELELEPHPEGSAQAGGGTRWVLAAAAMLLVVLAGAVIALSVGGDDERARLAESTPATAPTVAPADLDRLGEVCAAYADELSTLAPDGGVFPGQPGDPGTERALSHAREMTDALLVVVADTGDALPGVARRVTDVDDQLRQAQILIDAGNGDSVRYSLPVSIVTLEEVVALLGAADVVECRTG